MGPLTVTKIDLCGSKDFAQAREKQDPSIRTRALRKLLDVSKRSFPEGASPYPAGTFYKADGDAVTFVIESPSVALRGSIEFMQTWYHEGVPAFPECRVFLDYGPLDQLTVPGKTELTGRPFENISVFEKGLNEGRIYLTGEVINACDRTMAKFVFQTESSPRPGEKLRIYAVDFLDPRTVSDSALIHALFVAHPKAAEARERIFEIFAVEFLLEQKEGDLQHLMGWCRQKGHPVPETGMLSALLERSSLIQAVATQPPRYTIRPEARDTLTAAREAFRAARSLCLAEVRKSLSPLLKADAALGEQEEGALVEDYLCGVFSEIRMMANYFRSTSNLFALGPQPFLRFDYIIRRHLAGRVRGNLEEARNAVIAAIRRIAEQGNEFIAAVFHNVLATYYLNRAGQASAYQESKLKERQIVFDTNILYALCVPASNYHGLVTYFGERLARLGVVFRIYPFSVEEYEHALQRVESGVGLAGPAEWIVRTNPWLYQEFKTNPAKYLGSIAVCRQQFALAPRPSVTPKDYDTVDMALLPHGIRLEREFDTFDKKEVEDLWAEIRSGMTSSSWDLSRYWDFINQPHPEHVIRHDVMCVENVRRRAEREGEDELGPRVVFLTVDARKLLRLRKRYRFILSPEQFLEFMLPYLFLSDIPTLEADRFPNQLLAAQLGTLLVRKPPDLTDLIAACLQNPDLLDRDILEAFPQAESAARALNAERLKAIIREGSSLSAAGKAAVAKETAELLGDAQRAQARAARAESEAATLKAQLAQREAKLEKLQRTVKYWRNQARGKDS